MITPRAKAYSFALLIVEVLLLVACAAQTSNNIPKDFSFLMDVGTAEKGSPKNINIRVNAKGQGYFEEYDTNGTIQYDFNDLVTYNPDQILRTGKFKLTTEQQEQLWNAINENHFFDLTENYQMQIGYSYAFIVVQADGKNHKVDNIGLEVPQIRAIVETVAALLPDGVNIDYGKGYKPQK